MKSKKGKSQPARPSPSAKRRGQFWQIILLDQTPLRRAAATECQRAMARLDKAKGEWKRFESEDKTAFERWSAATFGPLLSRMREVEAALHEKEMLLQEVDMEMYFGGASSPRSAYRRVMKRRNAPPPDPQRQSGPDGFQENNAGWNNNGDGAYDSPPPGAQGHHAKAPSFDDLDEFEQECLFEEYLVRVVGMDPDRMSDAKYFRMFEEFREMLRHAPGAGSPPPPPPDHARPSQPSAPPTSEANRVKELYRLLVRRLHPDMRAESSNVEVSAIWHEVQEAYSHGNIERLEMLLALTDIQSNETGDHTSLFQMRSVLAELRRSFNALQKNLRAAKEDPSWNFGRLATADRGKLERRMRSEFQSKLTYRERELQRLETMIASWADRPKAKAPSPGKGGKKRVPPVQSDFAF